VTSQAEQAILNEWWRQLTQGQPTSALTHQVAQYLQQHGLADLDSLNLEATLASEDEVEAWIEASFAEDISAGIDYPQPDLSFLAVSKDWIRLLQTALQHGANWVHDALGALCFSFSTSPAFATATKSARTNAQIFRYELPSTADQPWEIEVAGFTQDEETFRLEVAIFKPDDPDVDLADVPITVVLGEQAFTHKSDQGGVAQFFDLPKDILDQILVRVATGEQ
jgi:hypothetical protein